MSRMLRTEHQQAVAMIGLNSHKELRKAFDESIYRKAWLIDGKLAAIGGITGPVLAAFGAVWLAFSSEATKYPLAMVKLMRNQLDEIMLVKRLLVTPMLEGDTAAERFAIFLGFVPATEDGKYFYPSAVSRYGRKEVARQLKEIQDRVPLGTGYAKVMQYRQIEAD
jgi:hypothetical protein